MSHISPNPACYRILGRADEIARMMNSPHVRAEHLFLIASSVPEAATFGFNWRQDDGRPWIYVSQPGNPRDALNTALVSLGRPPLT